MAGERRLMEKKSKETASTCKCVDDIIFNIIKESSSTLSHITALRRFFDSFNTALSAHADENKETHKEKT